VSLVPRRTTRRFEAAPHPREVGVPDSAPRGAGREVDRRRAEIFFVFFRRGHAHRRLPRGHHFSRVPHYEGLGAVVSARTPARHSFPLERRAQLVAEGLRRQRTLRKANPFEVDEREPPPSGDSVMSVRRKTRPRGGGNVESHRKCDSTALRRSCTRFGWGPTPRRRKCGRRGRGGSRRHSTGSPSAGSFAGESSVPQRATDGLSKIFRLRPAYVHHIGGERGYQCVFRRGRSLKRPTSASARVHRDPRADKIPRSRVDRDVGGRAG